MSKKKKKTRTADLALVHNAQESHRYKDAN